MTDIDPTSARFKIDALRKVKRELEQEVKHIHNEPCAVWRYRPEDWEDREGGAKRALREITDQIIREERSLVDPIQESEMRMELAAEMRLMGVRDDISLYFHTEEQEYEFQKRIQDQIDYGWYDEEGGWNEGIYDYRDLPHSCYCMAKMYDDDAINVAGWFMCESCASEAIAFMHFLSAVTGVEIREAGRWRDEWEFVLSDEESGD